MNKHMAMCDTSSICAHTHNIPRWFHITVEITGKKEWKKMCVTTMNATRATWTRRALWENEEWTKSFNCWCTRWTHFLPPIRCPFYWSIVTSPPRGIFYSGATKQRSCNFHPMHERLRRRKSREKRKNSSCWELCELYKMASNQK